MGTKWGWHASFLKQGTEREYSRMFWQFIVEETREEGYGGCLFLCLQVNSSILSRFVTAVVVFFLSFFFFLVVPSRV